MTNMSHLLTIVESILVVMLTTFILAALANNKIAIDQPDDWELYREGNIHPIFASHLDDNPKEELNSFTSAKPELGTTRKPSLILSKFVPVAEELLATPGFLPTPEVVTEPVNLAQLEHDPRPTAQAKIILDTRTTLSVTTCIPTTSEPSGTVTTPKTGHNFEAKPMTVPSEKPKLDSLEDGSKNNRDAAEYPSISNEEVPVDIFNDDNRDKLDKSSGDTDNRTKISVSDQNLHLEHSDTNNSSNSFKELQDPLRDSENQINSTIPVNDKQNQHSGHNEIDESSHSLNEEQDLKLMSIDSSNSSVRFEDDRRSEHDSPNISTSPLEQKQGLYPEQSSTDNSPSFTDQSQTSQLDYSDTINPSSNLGKIQDLNPKPIDTNKSSQSPDENHDSQPDQTHADNSSDMLDEKHESQMEFGRNNESADTNHNSQSSTFASYFTQLIHTLFCTIIVSLVTMSKMIFGHSGQKLPKLPQKSKKEGRSQELNSPVHLREQIRRSKKRNEMLAKQNDRKSRVSPIILSINSLKEDLDGDIDSTICDQEIKLKSLTNHLRALEKKFALRNKLRQAQCEYLTMIKKFTDLGDLLDLVRSLQLSEISNSLKDSISGIKPEMESYREQIESSRKSREKFLVDRDHLANEICVELERLSRNEEELNILENSYREMDLDFQIENWRSKVDAKQEETEKLYKEYIYDYYCYYDFYRDKEDFQCIEVSQYESFQ